MYLFPTGTIQHPMSEVDRSKFLSEAGEQKKRDERERRAKDNGGDAG